MRTWLAGGALALVGAVAWALPAQYGVSQLYHTKWTAHDGGPTGIESMAQTPDGFLWLGTSGGLFRFDGVQFERFTGAHGVALLSQDIFSVHVAADGALWVGHHLGGVSRLHEGRLVNYGGAQGLPPSSVTAFSKDADGTVWAGTTRGLYRLVQGRWTPGGTAWAGPSGPVDAMLLDRDRTLWVMSDRQVFWLRAGAQRFEKMAVTLPNSNFSTLMRRPDGSAVICVTGQVRTLPLSLPAALPTSASASAPAWQDHGFAMSEDTRCTIDREGHLWIAGIEGLTRAGLRNPAAPAGMGRPRTLRPEFAPLSGESISSVLEDREGNLWVSTRAGLDRFRAPALLKLSLDAGSNEFALTPAGDDGVWVGTSKGNLFRVRSGGQEQIPIHPLASAGIDTLATDTSGTLWVAGADSLWRRRQHGAWQRLPRGALDGGAKGGQAPYAYSNIEAMTPDGPDAMWVSVLRSGVYRVVDDTWTLWGGRTDLPTQNATALFTDSRGRVWFGHDDGTVNVLEGGRLSRVVASGGRVAPEALGAVAAFMQQGEHLWVGTQNGLWHVANGDVLSIKGMHGAFIGVSGIAADASGDLWLSTVEGVVHLSDAEVQRALRQPGHAARHDLWNHLDGLPGLPEGAVANGGRLWFATVSGVVWADPGNLPRNAVVPSVSIRSVTADGTDHPFGAGAPVELPANTRDLTIAYTAPSLTMPERVQFRYRLGDGPAEWQDVGTRREAYFRDLTPGPYHFQVLAANNDGVWNEVGAGVDFVIPPTFVQTRWFTGLCVLVGAGLLWLLYLLRLRSVKARLRLRLEERMVERERIARELHDTFLQAVQGLVLRFHSAMQEIPPEERSRELMRRALDRADEVIADGRDAVTNLRVATDGPPDFVPRLREFGERWSQDTGIAFVMSVNGTAAELDPVALRECERIATEALSNAFRHAEARQVRLTLHHEPRTLHLQVSDDGRGFDPDAPAAGRWGLVGMRERAARLTGRLRIVSSAAGTTVTLDVPGRIAYRRRARGWRDRGRPTSQR